jgi:RNA polymerase sigma-70 factor (ECF subfamily)
MIDTNETLLERVRKTDAHDAWKLFYEQYWAVILGYARKLGLNEHQAEEVLQETMVALMRQLPEFQYDRNRGKFRNFLLTIVHRKSLAALRRARRERDTKVPWETVQHEQPDEAPARLTAEMLERWQESVLEAVLQQLARDERIGTDTLAVFRAYVIEGLPASEVAARFGLKENAVYQIKNRLSRRVQEKVERRLRDSDWKTA